MDYYNLRLVKMEINKNNSEWQLHLYGSLALIACLCSIRL